MRKTNYIFFFFGRDLSKLFLTLMMKDFFSIREIAKDLVLFS